MLIVVGLAAALLLATGFVLQQHEAAQSPGRHRGPALLLELARRPIWLAGILAMVGGQVLGATALGMGSLVVVEPMLATNVLFALPMAAVASRRRLRAGDWIGALMLVGGLALFLLGSSRTAAVDRARIPVTNWIIAGGTLLAVVLLLLVLGWSRGPRARAALLATAAGGMFGMQDFLTQRTVLRLDHGVAGLLASWPPWVLIGVAVTGLTLAQRAFGIADLSASLPAINLAEPVSGIALSVGVLGQVVPRSPGLLSAGFVGLAFMVAGVVVVARSPLVVDPHGRRRHLGRHPSRRAGAAR